MTEKKMTPHQQKSKEFGISPVLIAQAQRSKALPADIKCFDDDDDAFLAKLARTLADPKILRIQLSKLSKTRRESLVETTEDADLKRWEFHAMQLFVNSFREGKPLSTPAVLQQLHVRYKVQNGRTNRERLQSIRRVARLRVKREQQK